jgi:hypothetical protein
VEEDLPAWLIVADPLIRSLVPFARPCSAACVSSLHPILPACSRDRFALIGCIALCRCVLGQALVSHAQSRLWVLNGSVRPVSVADFNPTLNLCVFLFPFQLMENQLLNYTNEHVSPDCLFAYIASHLSR